MSDAGVSSVMSPKERGKSLILLSVLMLSLFVIILAYVYISQVDVFWRQTIEHITVGAEKYESIIHSWFAPKLKLADIISADLRHFSLTEDDELGSYFTKIAAVEPDIMAVYIATEDGNSVFDSGREPPEGYDPTVRVWYVAARENSGVVTLSEPYIDILTGDLVVTICKTVQLTNGLDGVIGIDVGLTDIIDFIGDIRPYDSGTSFLLSRNGNIVTHANADYMPKEIDGAAAFSNYQDIPASNVRQIDNNNEKVSLERLVTDGIEKYVSKIVISEIDWYYGNEIPVADFYNDLSNLSIPLVLTLVLGLAIFSFVVSFYINLINWLRKTNQEQAEQVYHDALTGVYNRRHLDENLPHLISSLSRSGGLLSLLMLDIDHFKQYNDTYGHERGDVCLKSVADVISTSITRTEDFVVRYGGEEFVVVLPNTAESGVRLIAEKMLENMRERGIPHKSSGIAEYVTFSIGAATGKAAHTQSSSDYIKRADEMMYASKKNGRNRYTFSTL